MLSEIKPDQNISHEFVVDRIVDKEKEFPSSEGVKQKYVIYFDNGYAAEYCPLRSLGFDQRIQPGKKLLFRIIFRKHFGDEIQPFASPAGSSEVFNDKNKIVGSVVHVGGHPAAVAISCASKIYAGKIQAGIKEEHYGVSNMLEDADLIMKWLIDKVTNPE